MARKFKFRLEVVERVRRQARDERRRIVADAVRAVRRMEAHTEAVATQLRRSVEETAATQRADSIDVALVRTQEYHRTWLHRQLAGAREELAQRQKTLASKRHDLAEATKQLRVIEKLRERQWQRHLTEVKREEQTISDEIAITRYLRVSSAVAQGRAE